ncbi:MAG: hypothetical protein GX335_06250 [Firmicutes bacterium]|mgnify:CR=1 FL=1|nr:hypothetical protein [Bacillota bacterium]
MQYSDYLTEMAALIRENPSITVREIAAELKFADSKSVYYWLEKSNIGGIKEFKRLVLKEEPLYKSSFALEVNENIKYGIKIPLYSWNPKQKKPLGEWPLFAEQRRPKGLLAIRVETAAFAPWFLENDLLVVEEGSSFEEGSWLLLNCSNRFALARVINSRIFDFCSLRNYEPPYTITGVIVKQIRYWPS